MSNEDGAPILWWLLWPLLIVAIVWDSLGHIISRVINMCDWLRDKLRRPS